MHNVNMPETVNAGDLLVMLVGRAGGNLSGAPSGWTSLVLNNGTLSVFIKKGAGTEGGGTVSVETVSNTGLGVQVYRVTGWADTGIIINDVEINTASGISTAPNPPSLNPAAWDIEDTLWLAVGSHGVASIDLTGYPTNYTNGTVTTGESGITQGYIYSARRQNAVESENPASFSISGSASWRASTIAIRPVLDAILLEGSVVCSFNGTAALDAVSDIVFIGAGALEFDGEAQVTQNAVFEGAEEVSFDGLADLSGGAILMTGEGEVSFDGTAVLNQEALFEGFADVEMNGLAQLGVIQGFAAQAALMFDGSASLSAIGWQEVDVATNQIWTVKK